MTEEHRGAGGSPARGPLSPQARPPSRSVPWRSPGLPQSAPLIDASIRMDVTVAHVEDQHIGFRCEHIDLDSITHLRRLVELNVGDIDILNRELSALGQ